MFKKINEKRNDDQSISFVDVFGHMIGETLLGDDFHTHTLSQQQQRLENGAAPMPLYTCLNVKADRAARLFR